MDSTEAVDMDSEDQPIVTDPQHNLLFPLTINRYEAISHPDMILLPSRLKSFEGKISKAKQTPQQLAEAGFYCDIDGGCICYYCGIGIYKWKPEDDPWVEHALLASHCGFLNLWKSELKFKIGETPPPVETIVEPIDIYLCKICQTNVANHVYLPCRHLVSCLKCATTQDNCPICREKIIWFLKIIL